jgi:hypothetical protein
MRLDKLKRGEKKPEHLKQGILRSPDDEKHFGQI